MLGGFITLGYSHLILSASSMLAQLSHTKDNQPNNTRRLDWVLYEQCQFPLKTRIGTEQTKSDNLGILDHI